MKKYAIALLAAAATLVVVAAASAANTTSNSLAYEFDNGTSWTLQQNTAALNTTYSSPSYSDVGIVVDLGQAKDFTGLSVEGSNLQANIWLGDDPEAYTPDTHLLSATILFSYGPWGQTFWTGDQAGQPVSTAHIQTLGTTEVYAWVGIVYTGGSVSGSISSINGKSVGNRTMSITNNGDGTVTALVH
jgi:hypothetical protein